VAIVTVGVVGLGLIGGSLALDLVDAGVDVVATTRAEEARAGAAAAGVDVVDDVASVVRRADLVVLAVPVPALDGALESVASALGALGDAPRPTVTDVGSVKGPVLARAADVLGDATTFVGGHPMAGTERQGWSAAIRGLFRDRSWVVTVTDDVDLGRWAAVADLALRVGATVVPARPEAHDDAVALVSHLPYALAAVAGSMLDSDPQAPLARSLAAGSFSDLTRVAGGHPDLGRQIAVANRGALAARLTEARARLDALAGALDGLDPGWAPEAPEVAAVFAAGRRGRERLDHARAEPGPEATVALDRGGLVALGERGGRVVGVDPPATGASEVSVRVVEPAAAEGDR